MRRKGASGLRTEAPRARAPRQPWLAGFAAFGGLAEADIALVEVYSDAARLSAAGASVGLLGLTAWLLRFAPSRATRESPLVGALRWAGRLVGLAGVVVGMLLLPVPLRYVQVPGRALSATGMLAVGDAPTTTQRGDIKIVSVRTDPASLLRMLAARDEPATDVVTRAANIGSSHAVASEAAHLVTAAAAREAVAAAWRWMDVPVTLEGDGIVLLAVPTPLRSRLATGDVVETVDGRATITLWDFWTAVEGSPSRSLHLGVRRDGRHMEVVAPVAGFVPRPKGLTVAPTGLEVIGAQPAIGIDFGGAEGNSAGLAWALAVVQRVGQVDLAGGRTVVVTGALSPDGVVHPVKGIPQKSVAAERGGASVFVVPEDAAALARSFAGSGVRVIGVRTLDQAVAELRRPVSEPR